MLNLVFCGACTCTCACATVPVTNLHIELRASRQLIRPYPEFKMAYSSEIYLTKVNFELAKDISVLSGK